MTKVIIFLVWLARVGDCLRGFPTIPPDESADMKLRNRTIPYVMIQWENFEKHKVVWKRESGAQERLNLSYI